MPTRRALILMENDTGYIAPQMPVGPIFIRIKNAGPRL
jgi:hypothetical protein